MAQASLIVRPLIPHSSDDATETQSLTHSRMHTLTRHIDWLASVTPSTHYPLPTPRRPGELLPSKDVEVEVVHALAPLHPVVDDHPEALAQLLLLGHRLRRVKKVTWDVGESCTSTHTLARMTAP